MFTDKHLLKRLQADVLKGYSILHPAGFDSPIYIKHMDMFVSAQIEDIYVQTTEQCKILGMMTEKELLELFEKQGVWSKKDDNNLEIEIDFLRRLDESKKKQMLKSEVDSIKHEMEIQSKKIADLQKKRAELFGKSAESFAETRSNNYYQRISCFKDMDCQKPYFTAAEFEELEDQEASSLSKMFNDFLDSFSPKNIKRIAASSMFLNYFYLCEDNSWNFYGKPVSHLTFNQAELFGHAKYYKYIISSSKRSIPPSLMDDPDKLVEWFEAGKNAERHLDHLEHKEDMNVSLVGATKEDLAELDMKGTKKIDLAEEAKKRGGNLTFAQMMELQGL